MTERARMAADPTGDELRPARLAMLSALADGDVRLARRVAAGLLDDGVNFDELVDVLFAPLQHEFGQRWSAGDLSIADEHAASACVAELITSLSAVTEPPSGPTVVVATAEHESHALGARTVAATLSLAGFRSVFLGAALPSEDLAEFLVAQEPFALALSCSISAALEGAARSVAVAHEHGVPVVAGGRALPRPEWAERLGVDGHARSARDAAAILEAWAEAGPPPLRLAPEPIPEHDALHRRWVQFVADAIATAGDHTDRPDRLADEMRRVLLVAEAAVLLDEPAILHEHLEWLRTFGPLHGISREAITLSVPALGRAVAPHSNRIAALIGLG
jgi:methanogenic corrinoid protein MtbC1